jgi:isocitrate/isopropylmalate dehydrogenase
VRRIALIPGDGIGPEVVDATRSVVEAAGVTERCAEAGAAVAEKTGETLPDDVLDVIRGADATLKDPSRRPSAKASSLSTCASARARSSRASGRSRVSRASRRAIAASIS